MRVVAVVLLAAVVGYLPVAFALRRPPPLMGDEAYYARVPVEMRQRGDWLVPYFNGEPRYKKPPLLYWCVAASYALLGESEAAARLPSLLAIWATAALLIWFGRCVGDALTGWLAAAAFLLNPMTVLLGNWGAPEATLTFFVTASTLVLWHGALVSGTKTQRGVALWWLSGALAGLGTLTKGAPGLALPLLGVGLLVAARWRRLPAAIGWLLSCAFVATPWFVAVGLREGQAFWQVFLWREHVQRVAAPMEGHHGPLWFYLPVLILALFPWSVRLPAALWHAVKGTSFARAVSLAPPSIDGLMAWWALAVIALFSIAATKLPHYIFPALPACAWLLAKQWQRPATRGEWAMAVLIGLTTGVTLLHLLVNQLPDALMAFLRRYDFALSADEFDAALRALTPSAFAFAATGIAAALLVSITRWRWNAVTAVTAPSLMAVNAAALTLTVLLSGWAALHWTGGDRAAQAWRLARHAATFGSDTEWAVFYARRMVPMLRDEKALHRFVQTQRGDAAVLARVDFAPALRQAGLHLTRFGIWVVGR